MTVWAKQLVDDKDDQMIPPRGMSKEQAAACAGCETLSAFNDLDSAGDHAATHSRNTSVGQESYRCSL
ncbi:protein of unknown function [Bradyrhizobium vignae]|uniref:Uncharacterized protein n=1 Tax=Bradyrhizobium vignae TaxID=1549949 RepID=A0A2U3Q913_9BRAD|nr:protein of unknown function [Bradyrhizobium vignae]